MGIIVIITIWVLCGFVCEYLGNQKGQKGCFLYGLLLGFIGIIIVACLKDKSGETKTNSALSKYDELEKLQKLKESGTLTEVEFEAEKQKILK